MAVTRNLTCSIRTASSEYCDSERSHELLVQAYFSNSKPETVIMKILTGL